MRSKAVDADAVIAREKVGVIAVRRVMRIMRRVLVASKETECLCVV